MKRLTLVLGMVALAAALAACSGASAAPTTDAPALPAGDAVSITAKDLLFAPTAVTVPADTAFAIAFDNQESAPHNVAISDASGASVFKGEIVSSTTVTYNVPALAVGTYPFICEVHPAMTGTITAK